MDNRQLKRKSRLLILFVLLGLISFIMIEWLIDEIRSDGDWVPVNAKLQEWLDWGKDFAPKEPQIININEASEADFTTLAGIGPAKAKQIVTYREENGPFQSIEDIMEVSGIGPATFENIKEWITIGEEDEAAKEDGEVNEIEENDSLRPNDAVNEK